MKSPVASATAARRRIIERFEAAKATAPAQAIAFACEGAIERRMFEQLRAAGVLVESEAHRFHLDAKAWEEFRRRSRGKVAIAIGVAVAGALWALAS